MPVQQQSSLTTATAATTTSTTTSTTASTTTNSSPGFTPDTPRFGPAENDIILAWLEDTHNRTALYGRPGNTKVGEDMVSANDLSTTVLKLTPKASKDRINRMEVMFDEKTNNSPLIEFGTLHRGVQFSNKNRRQRQETDGNLKDTGDNDAENEAACASTSRVIEDEDDHVDVNIRDVESLGDNDFEGLSKDEPLNRSRKRKAVVRDTRS
ncbi:hypothetical protein EDD21DRAFT_417256 [Dissophora ornata]|nr:hypothetical protein EDD21DRAFT_417256 [Dissophora ornata]